MTADAPQFGVQYRLTGNKETPCIMNGNSWEESKYTPTTLSPNNSK